MLEPPHIRSGTSGCVEDERQDSLRDVAMHDVESSDLRQMASISVEIEAGNWSDVLASAADELKYHRDPVIAVTAVTADTATAILLRWYCLDCC